MAHYGPLWLQQGSYPASSDRRLIAALWPSGGVTGMAVSPGGSGMSLSVAPGSCAVPSANNTGATLCGTDSVDNSASCPAAPASGLNRYDVVTVLPRGNDLDGGANNDWILSVVSGTAAATPTVPAVPAGQLALAQIYVPGGSASVSAGNITDVRTPLGPALGRVADARGPAANTPIQANYITATATFRAIAGRRYRINANAAGYNNGSAAALMTWSFYDETGTNWVMSQAAPAVGSWFGASYVWQLVCATTRVVTYQIQGAAAVPAVLQTPANNTLLLAEDIGPV
jgi:hypothetical protein